MDAYRDQYATIFNGGNGVQVFGISVDADTALASWAKDKQYPVTFLSDLGATVGQAYGIARQTQAGMLDSRVVFVIGPDGTIQHVMAPFRETDPTAYEELGGAVARIRGGQQ
ncbi:MAG: redoxin domain-containing protein [Gemmatimonadales bacterium]